MTTPLYHKIESIFKRDPDNHHKTFLTGEWSYPELKYLSTLTWEATEKVDGTNMRIHVYNETGMARSGFTIGGRTDNAQLHVDLINHTNEIGERIIHNMDLEGLTLYGEGYGAGIQKGGDNYRPDKGFVLFDVMVTETGVFLERENVEDIGQKLGIPVVPILWRGQLVGAVEYFTYGPVPSEMKTGEEAEGWVLRPLTELRTRLGKRIITKIKVKDFERTK